MANETINKYIVSINDSTLRLILQTMMKFSYKLNDKVVEMVEKIDNPINVDDLLNKVSIKIAEKM
jgi:hypothetical protein